jgi:putative methyltransferase (TIGR04325 family)
MKQRIIRLAKSIVPPIALDIYHDLSRKKIFSGNYKTWDEALRASTGYDSEVILHKVREALLKVKKGERVYERDSVLFDEIQYSWPLLSALLWVASREGNRLNLVDFGGSLGSSYYQNIKFLSHLRELNWSVVEQIKFVECGKRDFENEHVKFYRNVDECMRDRHPDTILFSSVLQYIDKPYDLLAAVINKGFKYILIDRTAFIGAGDDRLTVQKVPSEIYPAIYPAWFFNESKFLAFFSKSYELIVDFKSNDSANIDSTFKGFIFRLKNGSGQA